MATYISSRPYYALGEYYPAGTIITVADGTTPSKNWTLVGSAAVPEPEPEPKEPKRGKKEQRPSDTDPTATA